jgi:hypothetical protein
MKRLRSSAPSIVSLLCCAFLRTPAQAPAGACLPDDATSTSERDDFARMVSNRSAAGDSARALYHLPNVPPQAVEQIVTEALCTKAIERIRTLRGDGVAPDRVYLYRIGPVFAVSGPLRSVFSGTIWVFDMSFTKFLGGVLR